MPKKPNKVSAAKPSVPAEAAKAYAAVEAEIATLSPDALLPINVDIPRAVAIAIGAVPHLAKLRNAAAKLPNFDIAQIDRIGTYTLAAWHAHLLALPDVTSSMLVALIEEAKPLRQHLLLAAELLAHAGYFDSNAVQAIRAGQGNLDTANDLVALAALFTAAWPEVEHRSTVRSDDVEHAALLGPRILVALSERDQKAVAEPGEMSASERRQRAFTLFANAYDQCRRAATYLRWNEGDADELVSSIYGGRSLRRGKTEPDAEAVKEPATDTHNLPDK